MLKMGVGSGFLCPWTGRVLVLGSGGLRSGFLDLGSWIWNLGSGLFFLGSGFWAVCSWFWVLGCLFLVLASHSFSESEEGGAPPLTPSMKESRNGDFHGSC